MGTNMTRDSVRWARVWAIVLALALLGAACGDDDGAESSDDTTDTSAPAGEEADGDTGPVYGGTITVGLEAESNTWLPGRAQMAFSGHTVVNAIYDPLIALNGDGEFEPMLAESIEPSDDLSQWTLTLRPDVTFHDGTPLDAETLKWNFDTLHFHSGSLSWGYLNNAGVQGMTVIDPLTVRYDLAGPNAAFPDILTLPVSWPVSRAAYEADPENFGDHPVGTGPFVFEEWVRDGHLSVTRNEDYWGTDEDGNQLPYLDGIEFRPIPDETSRVQSLVSGDVDVMQSLRGTSITQVLELEDDGQVGADLQVGNFSDVVVLNVLQPPLDDVRIRRALALANDPEAAQSVLGVEGLAEISTGFYGPNSPWYSEAATDAYPTPDAEEAAALVEEYASDPARSDGKAPGDDVVITFNCQPDAALVQLAQLQQSLWQDVGLVVELDQVESAVNIASVVGTPATTPPFRGEFSTTCWRSGGGAEPLTTFSTFFGPVATNPANFTNFTDPEIDAQIEILRTSADTDERVAAVEAIGLVAAEALPVLWLTPAPSIVGFQNEVHGLVDWTLPSGSSGTATQSGIPKFHQVYVAR